MSRALASVRLEVRQAWREIGSEKWMPTWLVIAAFLSTGLFSCVTRV
jgi:hypothetical protein